MALGDSGQRSSRKEDPKAKLFGKFIQDKTILIADTSATSRTSIAGIMSGMGAKQANIKLASTYAEAEEEIKRSKPYIVLCDYDLGKKCGLDLLQKQRLERPETKESLFVLVTGNTSQSAVAKAAEEDIDTYILKPFTPDVLRSSIMKAVLIKVDPPEYMKVIERGKAELMEAKFDEAIRTFEYAKTLDGSPALACFYLGQARLIKQLVEEAQGSYQDGLAFNKIHYKCLVGLYEVLMSKKRNNEAYDVIKKISHYFPANPQRLTAVLRLAVVTSSYDDVERYYRIFTNIDERNEEMIKYICAALVVCGKYYLQQNHQSRALELFSKAATTAMDRTKILREIILALTEFNLVKQAEEFLKRFPPKTQSGTDYLAMELLVFDRQGNPRGVVIEKGRQLISKFVYDPVIYRILIQRSAEAGLAPYVEDLIQQATQKWPDQKASFAKAALAKKGGDDPARKN